VAALWFDDVHQLVDLGIHLEEVGVGLFADFALKLLPIHACQAVSFFLLHFSGQPILQAVVVNEAD
jgi:hypothetical protein